MTSVPDPPLPAPPRKASLRRATRNLRRAYRTIFALVILVFSGWAGLDALRWYELTYHVQTAQGVITKKHVFPRPPGSEYRLDYAFTAIDGTRIVDAAKVSRDVFDSVSEGEEVPVVYVPSRAGIDHWLFDHESVRTYTMYLTIGHGLAALLAILVLRLVEWPLARELHLAKLGYVAQGTIVKISEPRRRRERVTITYTFRTVAGVEVTGRCALPRRFPADTLKVGETIEVLYDPSKPALNKPRRWMENVEFPPLAA